MRRARTTAFSAVLVLVGAAASADLLVTKEGATIETAGAWRVDGRRVIFTLPNGALSSIRTDEIDLDRSALATARAAEAATASARPPAPAAPAAPILRLTEDDLSTATEESEASEEGEAAPKAAEAESASQLEVVSWDQIEMADGDGIQIAGTVRNNSKSHLTQVSVTATLYGEEGGMLANGDAKLNQSTIAPGANANFRVEFPGLPTFSSVKFLTSARGFETRPPESEGEQLENAPPTEEPPPAMDEPPPGADESAQGEDEAAADEDAPPPPY